MSSPQFVHPKSEEDPVLSPIFLSSADDVTSSSSSSNSSSHESGSPRNDWIVPSNINVNIANPPPMWPTSGQLNHFSMPYPSPDQWRAMDFESDIPSFLSDTSHHFSIDPNALHFGDHVYGRGCETNGNEQEALVAACDPALQFSYQFSSPIPSEIGLDVPLVHHIPTPMSTSAVSSLSRSPSPFSTSTYSQTPLQDTGINPNELTLISQRAREAAGVTLAIPVNANADVKISTTTAATAFQLSDDQILTPQSPTSSMSTSEMATAHTATSPKVAIPRLRPTQTELLASPSPMDVSVPVFQTGVPSQDIQPPSNQLLTKTNRPKTSHTTIERRYRTNLNARILALRRAVPALRILEKSIPDGGITQGKGLTGASAPKAEYNDVINERGYVDGVKAAKKNSKGVVLGKAVEYIKALKRREIRLRRETDGLKTLLLGLVGGPELLVEWEKEWRAKFGGEEMDEIEEDAEDDMDGDGDDGGGGDDDEDDEADEEDADTGRKSRPKKRGKVDTSVLTVKSGDKKSPSATSVPAPQTGEKRKRGRPRKIQTPPTNVEVPKLVLHPPNIGPVSMQQSQTEPPKYLLAAFVLFNLFSNSPFSPTRSSAPLHTHEGTVLTHHAVGSADTSVTNWPWLSFQLVNSVVSVLLLVYLLSDGTVREKLGAPLKALGLKHRKQAQSTKNEESRQPPRMGVLGLFKAAMMRCVTSANTSSNDGDLKAWRPISEAMVLNSSSPSLISAVQTYLSFSSVVAPHTAPFSDKITLALLSHAFSPSTAQKQWANLQATVDEPKTVISALERLALSLDLAEAIQIIERTKTTCFPDDTPVKKLARFLVLKSTKKLAAEEWLSCVGSSDPDDLDDLDFQLSSPLQQALVLEAGKQLGGKIGELVTMLERCHAPSLWCESERELETFEEYDEQESRSSASSSEELSTVLYGQESQPEEIENTRSMLLATVLYKQIFSQNFATEEHASPSPINLSNILALRRTLASAAFDCCPETEDARDRVVDILAELSRASKHR